MVEGDLPLDITWMFEGQVIEADRSDILISTIGRRIKQLTIEAVTARHAGEYTCVASNEPESIARSAKLVVNGTRNPQDIMTI